MGPCERVERWLCPDLPAIDLPYEAHLTRQALGAWTRRHRLLVTAGLLNGLAQPFFRPYDETGPIPAPARAAYLEWVAALTAEAAGDRPDADRMRLVLDEGERVMEALRAFEVRDQRRMFARRVAAMVGGSVLGLGILLLTLPLALIAGDAWAMALVGAWGAFAFASAMVHEVIVVPRLRPVA